VFEDGFVGAIRRSRIDHCECRANGCNKLGSFVAVTREMNNYGIACLGFQNSPKRTVRGDHKHACRQAADPFVVGALGTAALYGAERPGVARPAVGSQHIETPCSANAIDHTAEALALDFARVAEVFPAPQRLRNAPARRSCEPSPGSGAGGKRAEILDVDAVVAAGGSLGRQPPRPDPLLHGIRRNGAKFRRLAGRDPLLVSHEKPTRIS
jgi:hypothetical protein